MTDKFPLQSVLDLSHVKLDEATKRLGELIADQQKAAEQLQLLIQYRDEYHARFLAAAREGIGREQWRNYQAFLERLDKAIAQAEQTMSHTRQKTNVGQQDWIQKKSRAQAFDTLAQRHQARVDHAEARQDQKNLDEHASRIHQARSDGED